MNTIASAYSSSEISLQNRGHDNAFGFLRLFFASLVIAAHAPQFIDGHPARDPLYRLSGTVDLGWLAVNGFFVISGYMVVASYHNQPTIAAYLSRRIVRIYPGFIVAALFCICIVAPLAGADAAPSLKDWGSHLVTTIFLHQPVVPEAFAGTPLPELNRSMWTILHEFQCYMLVIVLGWLGAFRKRITVPACAAILLMVLSFAEDWLLSIPRANPMFFELLVGNLAHCARLTGQFLVGATFYLYRGRIVYRPVFTWLAFGLLVLSLMFLPHLAEPAFALLGAYVIFSVGFGNTSGPLARINNSADISYGVYLYAWPIGKLIALYCPSLSLPVQIILTFVVSAGFGYASWRLIESPMLALMKKSALQVGSASA